MEMLLVDTVHYDQKVKVITTVQGKFYLKSNFTFMKFL